MGEGQGHLRHSKHKLHTRRLTGTPTSVNQESALWQPQYRAEKSISHWLGHCSLIKVPRPLWKLEGEQIGCPDWDSAASFFISFANVFNMSSWAVLHLFWRLCRKAMSPWFTTLCFLLTLRRTSANYGLYSLILPWQSQEHIVQWRHYSLAANLGIKRSPPKCLASCLIEGTNEKFRIQCVLDGHQCEIWSPIY